MKYVFMNKNTELFDLEMIKGQTYSTSSLRANNSHLLPYLFKGVKPGARQFDAWWRSRRIPTSRQQINTLNHMLNGISLDELAERSYGLSLSDQYWIRPSENISWEDVNFFDNNFSEDVGNALITGDWGGSDLKSPDNTSDGMIKKRWKIIRGKRHLLKGAFNNIWYAEPFREILASRFLEVLTKGIPDAFVPYNIYLDKHEHVYSSCPNFITSDTEYVSFNQINEVHKRPNHISAFNFCRDLYGEHYAIFGYSDYIRLYSIK